MDTGEAPRFGPSPSQHGLTLDYYSKQFETATQATHPMSSLERQARTESELQLMEAPASATTMIYGHYNPAPARKMQQPSIAWTTPSSPVDFESQVPNLDFNNYFSPLPSMSIRDFMSPTRIPRSCPQYENSMLGESAPTANGFTPSEYAMETSDYQSHMLYHEAPSVAYAAQQSPCGSAFNVTSPLKMEQDSTGWEGMIRYDGAVNFGTNIPSEDGTSIRDLMDCEDSTTDQPYAKLIYRALLSAPNHSMVLQDIYKWFRVNTNKGSSDTKGWMNSIRHNLSMNKAFRKTERKITGDDSKKSTEWVLEEFAIKEGVQSTTRYRAKTAGNKRFVRAENPTAARQCSGRKGGLSASKTKAHRAKVGKMSGYIESGTPSPTRHRGLGYTRCPEFQHHTSISMVHNDRATTPLTPPMNSEIWSPCYITKKEESYDLADDFYRLENVQSVYMDDSPIFTNPSYEMMHDRNMEFLLHRNQRL